MSASWRPQTRLVHGGCNRSPHGETSEALFLTSGFCYERAEDAEARFAETQEGYTYSRVGDPPCGCSRSAWRSSKGSEDCAATASGMAAVHADADVPAAHRHAGRGLGPAVRLVPLDPDPALPALRDRGGAGPDGKDLGAVGTGLSPPGRPRIPRIAGQPDAGAGGSRRGRRVGPPRAGRGDRRQRVRDAAAASSRCELGADIVVYSATKHIEARAAAWAADLCDTAFRKNGCSPTCAIRGRASALSTPGFWSRGWRPWPYVCAPERGRGPGRALARGPSPVPQVLYPGVGELPTARAGAAADEGRRHAGGLRVGGGRAEAFAVLNRLQLIKISNNLGDAKSSSPIPPARPTRRRAGRAVGGRASPRTCCGCRSGWRTSTICWPI